MSDGQMLLIDGVNPAGRLDDDFYRTPRWMTRALLRRLYMARWTVIEPCCGDGAIVFQLPSDITVITNDIVSRLPVVPHFSLDATRAESWKAFERDRQIDLTLTNPPFDVTFDIVQHAWRLSRVGVVILQRCTWIEPTDDRGPWLAKHPPSAQIVMPRWNFRSVDGKGGNDSAPPSWFIWNKSIELVKPGIHVVAKAERDMLIAEESA